MKRLALLAIGALALTGCSSSAPAEPADSEVTAVVAAETAFLNALTDGDGKEALALTTLGEDEFTCADLLTDYSTARIGIILAKVGKATVSGDTASVDFTYSLTIDGSIQKLSGSHTLVRDGADWLIEFPDDYRISVDIGDDVIGQVGVMPAEAPREPYLCTATAVDGTYELIALPGTYMLVTHDPTGVFYNSDYATFASVYDGAPVDTAADLIYIKEGDRDLVASLVTDALRPYIDLCASSGFTDPTCQDGLPVPAGKVSITDYPGIDETTILSEDGVTWKFTVAGESFLFQRNGGIEAVDMYYTGTVTPLSEGSVYLQIALD